MVRSDLIAFVFIAFGVVLIIQGIFWTDPVKGIVAGGAALTLFGCYIWFRAPVRKEELNE